MTDEIISDEIQRSTDKLKWYHYVLSIISIICSAFVMVIFFMDYYFDFIENGIEQIIYDYPKLFEWHFRIYYILFATISLIITVFQFIFLLKKKERAIIITFLILLIWILLIYLSVMYLNSYWVGQG